jgi:broad specificity phosphatase PhoE/ribonuclease HI
MGERFVVEADGGSRGNPGPAAFGTVVRNASGQVLMEIAETLGRTTNNVAEYRGLIAGLEAIHQLAADAQIEARLDSKLVVEQMSGRWKIKHPEMRELAIRARSAHPPELVTYTWVPREKNRAADRLVNAALDGTWDPGAALTEDASEDEPVMTAVPTGLLPGTLPGWSPQVGVTTTTLLLRHGHTHHSAAKRFSGAGGDDPALNDLGVSEARAAAQSLAQRGGIDVIVTSPMRRTRQTADVVASAMACSVMEEPDFRECDFGAWEGFTFAEVQERWPEELDAWLRSTSVAPPDGESFDAVLARVDDGLARLRRDHAGQTVLVVSHVTPIKALVRAALGVDASVLFRMELLPASISTIRWYEDGAASLTGFNDVSHLRDGRTSAEPT